MQNKEDDFSLASLGSFFFPPFTPVAIIGIGDPEEDAMTGKANRSPTVQCLIPINPSRGERAKTFSDDL